MSYGNTKPQQHVNKPKPANDIDLQAMTVEPYIGSDYVTDRLRNKFRKFGVRRNEEGNDEVVIRNDIWATMEIFTQDMRLANLNKEEMYYSKYHIDICADILTALPRGFEKPALIMLERSVSVLELSQSKGGFLRRLFNTIFRKDSIREEKPAKRGFFGLGGKKGDN